MSYGQLSFQENSVAHNSRKIAHIRNVGRYPSLLKPIDPELFPNSMDGPVVRHEAREKVECMKYQSHLPEAAVRIEALEIRDATVGARLMMILLMMMIGRLLRLKSKIGTVHNPRPP